jgi:hypothetical protein
MPSGRPQRPAGKAARRPPRPTTIQWANPDAEKREQMFSGFAPLREDEDVVAVTRARSID